MNNYQKVRMERDRYVEKAKFYAKISALFAVLAIAMAVLLVMYP